MYGRPIRESDLNFGYRQSFIEKYKHILIGCIAGLVCGGSIIFGIDRTIKNDQCKVLNNLDFVSMPVHEGDTIRSLAESELSPELARKMFDSVSAKVVADKNNLSLDARLEPGTRILVPTDK